MKQLELTFRVVTPSFLGGAQHRVEFRLASFKGALRFWWRSLHGNLTTAELHRREFAIFGSSSQGTGRSRVRLRLVDIDPAEPQVMKAGDILWKEGGSNKRFKSAFYLGYGCLKAFDSNPDNGPATKSGQLERECTMPHTFTVRVSFAPTLSRSQVESVENALRLLGTVGGLGGRARRGWGSLTLIGWKRPGECDGAQPQLVSDNDPLSSLRRLTGNDRLSSQRTESTSACDSRLPAWTALTSLSRVIALKTSIKDPRLVMKHLGMEFVRFRGYGKKGMVMDGPREQVSGKARFQDDHDLFRRTQSVPIDHPRRVVFGLPHNYGQVPSQHCEPMDFERRGSPLFFHLHQTQEDQGVTVVLLFLPSLYLPAGKGSNPQLKAFGRTVGLATSISFWDPVHDFLDRMSGKGGQDNHACTELRNAEVVS